METKLIKSLAKKVAIRVQADLKPFTEKGILTKKEKNVVVLAAKAEAKRLISQIKLTSHLQNLVLAILGVFLSALVNKMVAELVAAGKMGYSGKLKTKTKATAVERIQLASLKISYSSISILWESLVKQIEVALAIYEKSGVMTAANKEIVLAAVEAELGVLIAELVTNKMAAEILSALVGVLTPVLVTLVINRLVAKGIITYIA